MATNLVRPFHSAVTAILLPLGLLIMMAMALIAAKYAYISTMAAPLGQNSVKILMAKPRMTILVIPYQSVAMVLSLLLEHGVMLVLPEHKPVMFESICIMAALLGHKLDKTSMAKRDPIIPDFQFRSAVMVLSLLLGLRTMMELLAMQVTFVSINITVVLLGHNSAVTLTAKPPTTILVSQFHLAVTVLYLPLGLLNMMELDLYMIAVAYVFTNTMAALGHNSVKTLMVKHKATIWVSQFHSVLTALSLR